MYGEQGRLRLPVHPGVVVRLAGVLPGILSGGAVYDEVTLATDLQSVATPSPGQVRSQHGHQASGQIGLPIRSGHHPSHQARSGSRPDSDWLKVLAMETPDEITRWKKCWSSGLGLQCSLLFNIHLCISRCMVQWARDGPETVCATFITAKPLESAVGSDSSTLLARTAKNKRRSFAVPHWEKKLLLNSCPFHSGQNIVKLW